MSQVASLMCVVPLLVGQFGDFAQMAASTPVAIQASAVQKAREAGKRMDEKKNLRKIGYAMHNYHSKHQAFPEAAIRDKNGTPLLSWRVAILPFFEQQQLYDRFKLDEPWDSEHNRQLIPLMPKTYEASGMMPKKLGDTHIRVFVGGGAMFDARKKIKITEITDGSSNTILAVETVDAVPWTKPDEVLYDAKKPLPRLLAAPGTGVFTALFADGAVRSIRPTINEQALRALISRAADDEAGELD